MTTNEQAEYTPTLEALRAEWVASNERADQEPGYPTDYAEQFDRAVAGERHRVAEQCAQIAEDKYRFDHGTPSTPCRTIAAAIRAAFPAVGGSAPAVAGEVQGDAKLVQNPVDGGTTSNSGRVSVGGSGGTSNVDGEEGDGQPVGVSEQLPLDPKPYVAWGVRYAEKIGSAYFDPHPGFSRDESRYRGDPTSTESRTA